MLGEFVLFGSQKAEKALTESAPRAQWGPTSSLSSVLETMLSERPGRKCYEHNSPRFILCNFRGRLRQIIRKAWMSIKFLSAKFGFKPPPEKGPEWGRTVQISIKSSKSTLLGGGGGEMQFYGQNDFMDIWAFLKLLNPKELDIFENPCDRDPPTGNFKNFTFFKIPKNT